MMSREIKFRGLTKEGKWVEGSLIQLNSGLCYITQNIHGLHLPLDGKLICEFTSKVIPSTVGQFTGLKDKNGREIYEGDIVILSGKLSKLEPAEVRFDTEDGMWKIGTRYWHYMKDFTFEVIGNIHDKEPPCES